MTISTATNKAQFSGNGVTTAFPFTFKTFVAGDLDVYLTRALGVDTILALTTHYTISLSGDQDASPGGTLTMLTAPSTGETLTILRTIDATQLTDITNGGGFYPQVVENALDKLTMLAQQNAEKLERAIIVGVTEAMSPTELLASISASEATAAASAAIAASDATSANASAAAAAASAALVDVTASSTTTFTNKSISGSANTLTNIPQTGLAANVVGNGPAFIAGMSAGQFVTNGSTQIATFNNEINDTNGNYDPATFRFTPNVPGYYLVSASMASADSAIGYTIVMIYKNSGSVARSKVKNSGQPLVVPATTIVYMNGTDYLTSNIYQDCGVSTTCGGPSIEQANFSAVLVRSA